MAHARHLSPGALKSLREAPYGRHFDAIFAMTARVFGRQSRGRVRYASRMQEGALDAALREAPVGFAVVEGPSMIFTTANAKYLEMVSRSEVVGKPFLDVFPELAGTPTLDALKAAYTGKRIEHKELLIPLVRDGKLQDGYYSFILDPLRTSEGVSGFVMVGVEVTEVVVQRMQAEALAEKLRDSEARYRALFSAIDDGFCLLQVIFAANGAPVDYRFLETNEAFERHTGLSNAVGKTARQLVPDLDESWFRLYGRVATTGEAARFENNAPAMGRWFDVFASRVGEPERAQVGLVFKNVSERKRIELEKERLLEAEQAARRDAEAANRLKDDFLATVSHELRTPLNAMLGWVSLLRGGHVAPEKIALALETIERNARAQAELVSDLLDVSRIVEGKLRLDVQPVDLAGIIPSAVETVRPAAQAKSVSVESQLEAGAVVLGDSQRLEQVIWNLLSNAVKFTQRGGHVDVALRVGMSEVELIVTDTGVGISKDFLPHVFERFRQADGGTTRLQGGLGLGMSIVKQLTEMHGGTVSVASEGSGRGTVFVVRLPRLVGGHERPYAAPAPSREMDYAMIARPPELERLDIIAVDDDSASLEMLRNLLESCRARVRVASSAAEALRKFQEEPPTVLVSDIAMPNEDGFSLIEKVRSFPAHAGGGALAVALTAYAGPEDRKRCLLAGFDGYVPKPVEPSELIAVLTNLTKMSQPRRTGV